MTDWLRRGRVHFAAVLSEKTIARIMANVAHMISGSSFALLIGVVTLGIMARALGPAALGIIVLVESYGKLVDQVFRLETWQALIRYGTAALEQGDQSRFLRLIKFSVCLDLAGALTAGVICYLLAHWAGQLMGWSPETAEMAQVYAVAVFFGISSTPIGLLRIFDRFWLIAWLEPVAALIRLFCIGIAAMLEASPWAFLLILVGVQIAHRAILALLAYITLIRLGYAGYLSKSLKGTRIENPGLWGMILSANGTVLVRKSMSESDVLVVGAMLGSSAAGIYQIARRLGNALIKAGGTLQTAAFPDLARLWARGETERFRKVVTQIELITVAGTIVCSISLMVLAEPLVVLIAGQKFAAAATPLVVHSISGLLYLGGTALRPALASMGLQAHVLAVTIMSALVFYATLPFAIAEFGITGASASHLIANAILLPAIAALFARGLRMGATGAPAEGRFHGGSPPSDHE